MSPQGQKREVIITRPNRDKSESQVTRVIVILLLLASVALMLIVTFGGWSKLAGLKFIDLFYIAIYLVMAFYVGRWNRGVLPIAAALAMILGIFAAIAGPAWFDRDKAGFSSPALNENILGLLTLLIIPVQVLLIAIAMRAFGQAWNVEVEVPVDRYLDTASGPPSAGPGEPATA